MKTATRKPVKTTAPATTPAAPRLTDELAFLVELLQAAERMLNDLNDLTDADRYPIAHLGETCFEMWNDIRPIVRRAARKLAEFAIDGATWPVAPREGKRVLQRDHFAKLKKDTVSRLLKAAMLEDKLPDDLWELVDGKLRPVLSPTFLPFIRFPDDVRYVHGLRVYDNRKFDYDAVKTDWSCFCRQVLGDEAFDRVEAETRKESR